MTALFADTFYWIALADSTDGAHQRALAEFRPRVFPTVLLGTEPLARFGLSGSKVKRRSEANEAASFDIRQFVSQHWHLRISFDSRFVFFYRFIHILAVGAS